VSKHVNTKMILGIVIASAFILGSVVTPIAALQTNMVEESFNYAYAPGDNNHTYIYSAADDPLFLPSSSMLYCNESTEVTSYVYGEPGWSSSSDGFPEDTSLLFEWQPFDTLSSGPLGNPTNLPVFFDFIGSDGSGAVVNTTFERRSFSLGFGQHTAVAMDSDYLYYGTLGISGQEFVHLTIACQQDGFTWTVRVLDPEGNRMGSVTGSGGNILILPFRPSTVGTYTIVLQSNAMNGEIALFDFIPEAIAPRLIAPGEIITDTLPTGEIRILEGTESWLHDELVPTIHTYKMNPGDDVSSLTYAFNYPIPIFMWTQPPSIIFTSDAWNHGTGTGYRYESSIYMPQYDVYNFGDGVHYVTVIGGDNVDYTLYHDADVATELVVNQEFKVDNLFGHTDTQVYSLTVTEDSIMKINSTSTSDFDTNAWVTLDDGYRYYRPMTDGSTLQVSSYYYLPAGEYIFEVDVSMYISEWIEFTLGPLTTDTSAGIVNVGGFIVPTDPSHKYNLTLTLDNLYNVSVPIDFAIFDQFYSHRYDTSLVLGTWFDGSTQIPHASQENTLEYSPSASTAGVGNDFENFPVNITINWEDVTYDDYVDTAFLDISSSSDAHNFTLPLVGTPTEQYALMLNTTPGTWYNVTIHTNDVSSLSQVISFGHYNERTHYTNWGDLSDELQGVLPDLSIQFGAIAGQLDMEFTINRALIEEGHLWIEITPMETHELVTPPPLAPVGADILSILGDIAVPLGIGVVVIVVVVVVYVKKFKK